LLEVWSLERGTDVTGVGSWTVRRAVKARGLEPDECYLVATPIESAKRPDLAIEVVWTHGGIDKLEVYRRLEVPQAWIWRHDRIEVRVLRGERYEQATDSEVLPDLDLVAFACFVARPDQAQAVREYQRHLRHTREPAGAVD